MKKLNFYIHIFCSSYTIATLLVVIVNKLLDAVSPDIIWNLQMALLCGAITVLMYITDLVAEKFFGDIPNWLTMLIGTSEVILCVFLLGGLCFEWFPFNLFWIIAVIVIDIIIYLSVFGIMCIHDKQSAKSINQILKNNRSKNKTNGSDNDGKDN